MLSDPTDIFDWSHKDFYKNNIKFSLNTFVLPAQFLDYTFILNITMHAAVIFSTVNHIICISSTVFM